MDQVRRTRHLCNMEWSMKSALVGFHRHCLNQMAWVPLVIVMNVMNVMTKKINGCVSRHDDCYQKRNNG